MKKKFINLAAILFILTGSTLYSQTVEWAKKYGGVTYSKICPGSSGDAFVMNSYANSTPSTYETYTLNGTGQLNVSISHIDASGNVSLVKAFNGTPRINSGAMNIDGSGNFICAGTYSGTQVLDSYTLSTASGFDENAYLFKMNSSGAVQWVNTLDNNVSLKQFVSVQTDQSGNIYAMGIFRNNISIGSFSYTSSGGLDVFIVKYNSNGNAVWVKKIGGASDDGANDLKLDQAGNIYVVGAFSGNCTFGPYFLVANSSNPDGFVCKINNNGNFLWCKKYGSTNFDEISRICTTYTNSIYLSGRYSNTTTIGSFSLSSSFSDHQYLSKLDTSGNVIWVDQFCDSQTDCVTINGICSDASNAVYFTGGFSGMVCFGSTSLSAACITADNFYNAYISKLDPSGNYAWLKQVAGGIPIGDEVVEKNGKIFASGGFQGSTITVDSYSLTGGNNAEYFLKISTVPIGIKEYSGPETMTIFPNPLSSTGILQFEGLPQGKSVVSFYDLAGRKVSSVEIIYGKNSIEGVNLAPGIYLLKLHNESKQVLNRKIVVE